MSKMWIQGIALVLLLAALPLISIGTTQENEVMWWIGLGLLMVAGAAVPITRFAMPDDGDDGEAQSEAKAEG